jgi:hypothetical protein
LVAESHDEINGTLTERSTLNAAAQLSLGDLNAGPLLLRKFA